MLTRSPSFTAQPKDEIPPGSNLAASSPASNFSATNEATTLENNRDELVPSPQKYDEALEAGRIGLTIWDLKGNKRFRTKMANELLGLNTSGFAPSEFEKMVNQA